MSTSVEGLTERLHREIEAIWRAEPDEMKVARFGMLPNRAGSYDQHWTTWEFANGMIRDFSMYTMYPMYRWARGDDVSLEVINQLIQVIHPPYCEYLRYSGCLTLSDLERDLRALLPSLEDKQDFLDLYRLLLLYANKLAAWAYHYFPWELGVMFPQQTREDLVHKLALIDAAPPRETY